MYNSYFGFTEAPFSIAPDPRYLYMTTQHREALAHLVYGLNSEGGCILLTGEVGTGKTTICRCLLDQIPKKMNVALILNPKLSEIELLETMCDELKINYPSSGNTLKTYTDRIYDYLIEKHQNDEKTILIIDEAQNLSIPVLEQLRLLTNLETDQRKLLQIIILGQPELLDILATQEMRQLSQRITARFHLKPLTKYDIKSYISHRLAIAGQNLQLFPDDSIKVLYKLSKGVPRIINTLCDRSLLGTFVENQLIATPTIVKKAAKEIFGETNTSVTTKIHWPTIAILLSILSLFAFLSYSGFLTKPAPPLQATSQKTTLTTTPEKTIEKKSAVVTTPSPASKQVSHVVQQANDPQVMHQPNIATPRKNNIITLANILGTPKTNQSVAINALFDIWGEKYDAQSNNSTCQQAHDFSLVCLEKIGNINSLKHLNRPAILTLKDNNAIRFITITALNPPYATISINNSLYQILLEDINKYWYGEFIIFWAKPELYQRILTPKSKAPFVNWLREKLIALGAKLKPDNPLYSKELVAVIKSFQSQVNVEADGIVGPITIIHLNSLTDQSVPQLKISNNIIN